MHALQQLLDDFMAANTSMPGALLHVEAPSAGVSWSGASGVVERGGGPLDPSSCFRTASVTKTFVATALLRLAERGGLAIDDPVLAHLPDRAADLLVSHAPLAGDITLRHVLRHTSGVYDFGNDSLYRRTIALEPSKVWSAYDLIGLAFAQGAPYCPPGQAFHYSDTGYVLLALVLEHRTSLGFAAALRDLAGIDDIGLTHTWLEGKEPAPPGAPPRAHQYVGADDTFAWDPSFDGYGGGGLVSTSTDLVRFIRSVLVGDLLTPESRASMLDTCTPTGFGLVGQRHGLGVFETIDGGFRRLGHEGFWGVWMYHFPDHDVTVGGVHTALPFDPESKERLITGPVRLLAR